MADIEEELNIRKKLMDELTRQQSAETVRTDLIGKSVAEQENYLKILQKKVSLQANKLIEETRKELNIQRELDKQLKVLQESRKTLVERQKLLADQGDLFGQLNSDMSEIDAQIQIAQRKILESRTIIGANNKEIEALTNEEILVTLAVVQAKQEELRSIDAIIKSTPISLAKRQGELLRKALATASPMEKVSLLVGAIAPVVGKLGETAKQLLTTVYDIQQKIGTELGTAFAQYRSALVGSVKSVFTAGPMVSTDEIVDASAQFTKEFGTILKSGEATRIAREAKLLGVTSEQLLKSRRAFLGTGNEDIARKKAVDEFKKAGLTGAQALKFAADNANLVAIAGVKYADSLARAAANATKIGVSLSKTEQFADTIVGDFEGALAGFAEASAMGLEIDISRIFKASAIGGPEGIQKELSAQLGGNQALLRELQTNRNLKLAVQSAFPGLDIAEIVRLSGGKEMQPPELTVAEQSRDLLAQILEVLGKGGSIAAKVAKAAEGAVQGAAAGAVYDIASGGTTLGAGTAIGATAGFFSGFFGDDVISQPGYGTRALVTEQGVINLNNKDTVLAGTQLLSAGNLTNAPQGITGTPTMYPGNLQETRVIPQQQSQQTNVTVDMSKLEAKLDKLASAFSAIKIEMDGNTVGRVSLNARSPIDRLAVVG